jgi:protein-L-isoaspartate(D-aspartate) O-methyltransferase
MYRRPQASRVTQGEGGPSEDAYAEARARLAGGLFQPTGPLEPRVVAAIARVPRHLFVPAALQHLAYADQALPIGQDQTVSAPHMVALMCSVLDVEPGQLVLEVGAGSGYHAAVLAELVSPGGRVDSIEAIPPLPYQARENLERAGYADRVEVRVGDGAEGASDVAPFDRVSIAAATPQVPEPLLDQVKMGGALVVPLGVQHATLVRLERTPEGFRRSDHGLCVFVPLTGPHGSPRGGNGGGPAYV